MDAVAAGGTSAPAALLRRHPPRLRLPALRAVPGPAVAGGGEEIVPMTHIRKAIASHMVGSLQADRARVEHGRGQHGARRADATLRVKDAFAAREGFSLTYTPFVTRAVTEALLTFPMVNSELRGEDIVVRHFVNMGIAVSYDEGLIVPVVKGAGHDEPRRGRPLDQRSWRPARVRRS
jgi:pyruvate/2-oxoglutarate dehydrogenase complex dihydrolipoamide acyltransferase (E2) component